MIRPDVDSTMPDDITSTSSTGGEEVSMEDILASIRKIITADNGADEPEVTAPSAPPEESSDEDDDVLELTTEVGTGPLESQSPAVIDAVNTFSPPTKEETPPMQLDQTTPAAAPGLLDSATEAASLSALSSLHTVIKPREEPVAPPSCNVLTVESLVMTAATPFLKMWMEEHLPALVEKIVKQEIARLVEKSQLLR